MLKISDLNTYYGVIHALKGIKMEVDKGEIVSLIGSNGAGKTTLLNTIAGVTKASRGKVDFEGKEERYSQSLQSRRISDEEPIL